MESGVAPIPAYFSHSYSFSRWFRRRIFPCILSLDLTQSRFGYIHRNAYASLRILREIPDASRQLEVLDDASVAHPSFVCYLTVVAHHFSRVQPSISCLFRLQNLRTIEAPSFKLDREAWCLLATLSRLKSIKFESFCFIVRDSTDCSVSMPLIGFVMF